MAAQLFKLRNVPEDEAQEIRDLLSQYQIDYYETPAGNWGISMPAIWLNDEQQLEQAKELIEKYQEERQIRARRDYEQTMCARKTPRFYSRSVYKPTSVLNVCWFCCGHSLFFGEAVFGLWSINQTNKNHAYK